MSPELLRRLRERRPEIRERWRVMLRGEPVNSALAHPDALAFMIDQSIDAVLEALGAADEVRENAAGQAGRRFECPCGRNPLLAYFQAGEQAWLETLVLAQAEAPEGEARERAAAAITLRAAFRAVAEAEIEAFCGVCRYRAGGQCLATARKS